jgi:hypothetical protein
MKRTILAALLLGATTSYGLAADTAASDIEAGKATIVYDKGMSEAFKIKRDIVDRAQEAFGEAAAYETPQDLPDSVNAEIVPGEQLPEAAPTKPVPAELGDLPTLADDGSHWIATGNHLVEVMDDDNTIVMVVYNALP